jgi:hypothetical protein
MASLTQGSPLPNITQTDTTTTQGPSWYNQYLQDIASTGSGALTKATDTPQSMVAGFSPLQTTAFANAPGVATNYQTPLNTAEATATQAAEGITPGAIQSYMNPYTTNVVDEMARLSNENVNRNILPGLRAQFAGTGGFGSKRFAGATGQTLADIQANLTGAQQGALSTGFTNAADLANKNAQTKILASNALNQQAGTEATAGAQGLKDLTDLGALQQAREQAVINAPMTAASQAGNVLSNLKVPTTVGEIKNAPVPGAYSNSPLSQIAGIASLFASNANGTSAAGGLLRSLLGQENYDNLLSKGVLGSFASGDKAAGSSAGSSTGTSTTDPTTNTSSPLYGATPNEDGTYTGKDGAQYSSNGVKTWDPSSGYVNYGTYDITPPPDNTDPNAGNGQN